MTGYSWAKNERLRRNNLEDRLEAHWAAARQDGHAACEGWTFDPREARLVCSCGEVLYQEAADA